MYCVMIPLGCRGGLQVSTTVASVDVPNRLETGPGAEELIV